VAFREEFAAFLAEYGHRETADDGRVGRLFGLP
jgi:hypothetical protein